MGTHVLFIGLSGIIRNPIGLNNFKESIKDLDIFITSVEKKGSPLIGLIASICKNIICTESDDIDQKLLDSLDKIHKNTHFKAICCFSENYIQLTAHLAYRYKLIGNSIDAAINTTNKYEMRRILCQNNILVPRFFKVSSINEAIKYTEVIGYPCIIKPLQRHSSWGVLKIDSEIELEEAFDWTLSISSENSENAILIEEYIGGKEYSAEVVVNNGVIIFCGFTEKFLIDSNFRDEICHIHPFYFMPEIYNKVMTVIGNTIQATGVKFGGCHIEFKIENDQIYIIEIASRLGGGSIPMLVKISRHIDLVNLVIRTAIQEKIALPKIDEIICYAGVRFITHDKDCVVKTTESLERILLISGIINVSLFFEEETKVTVTKSGCQRLGLIIGRNRDKEFLLNSLYKADIMVQNSFKYFY